MPRAAAGARNANINQNIVLDAFTTNRSIMNPVLSKLLEQEWYTQGFAARPIFLQTVTGLTTLQQHLGFSYEVIFMNFQRDYCAFNYPVDGLKRVGDSILENLEKNQDYLVEKRRLYERQWKSLERKLKEAGRAPSLSDHALFQLLHGFGDVMEAVVGTSHLIEGISFRLEPSIRHRLAESVSGRELNEDFSILTAPTSPSFLSKKEAMLWKIQKSPKASKKKLVQQFIAAFYWVKSSYAGSNPWTVEAVLGEADQLKSRPKQDFPAIIRKKEALFEKHGFNQLEKNWIHWTEFLTEWQDDRKEKIYRSIYALDCLLAEISRRCSIERKLLHYLIPQEISIQGIRDGSLKRLAELRLRGCGFINRVGGFEPYDGKEFLEFEQAVQKKHEDVEILTGSCASMGAATGPVRICSNIASLEKVQQGDVLVASMTRPEYVSAMKKAVAIVTDEGGITCHAAIVSRELGIPCVIGTKKATKVLKDGWVVQVKANHGEVTVLEKK